MTEYSYKLFFFLLSLRFSTFRFEHCISCKREGGKTPLRIKHSMPANSNAAGNAPARNRIGLTNLQMRALTVVIVGPTIIAFGAYSEKCVTVLVFLATFIGGIEWSGLKRHLKVALLMSMDHPISITPESASPVSATPLSPGRDFVAPPPPPSPLIEGVPLCPEEYPLPVPPLSLYTVMKHIGWSLLAIAAYHGEEVFLVVFEFYFLIFVLVTLMAHNRLELKVGRAVDRLSQQFTTTNQSVTHSKETGAGKPKPTLTNPSEPKEVRVAKAQRNYFLSMELHMIAERQPTEQFLDFCLDIFGILWITGIIVPIFVYHIPNVGVPWLASTLVGNFMNDIAALVVGRSLKALRERYGAMYDATGEAAAPAAEGGKRPLQDASWVMRTILSGPHHLYRAISPNKSVEGAVAGVIVNAVTFSGLMFWFYTWVVDSPAPEVVDPAFQHVGLWFVVGASMGVLGVCGDLLQSLLKRAARVKDAGFIIPGHGGMLDRIDGMLLVFPFMYCSLRTISKMS